MDLEKLLSLVKQLYQENKISEAEELCQKIIARAGDLSSDPIQVGLAVDKTKFQSQYNATAQNKVCQDYHEWYYYNTIWNQMSWLGVKVMKSPADMWNYQEILVELQPKLIVEFGSRFGGSALFFSYILQQLGYPYKVFSVDIEQSHLAERAKQDPNIEFMLGSSTAPEVSHRIRELSIEYPGSIFAILDSDHRQQHVFQEMLLLRPILKLGDRLIVEDSNVNGHPVFPSFGAGPYEAIQEYFNLYPHDYKRDIVREQKFGFTFATGGFLIRQN